jgi:heptosyltransferase-2
MKTPLENVKRILVRAPNWLGDAVMALAAITALEKAYPKASLTLLAHCRVAGLYGLEKRRGEVVVYDPQGIHRGVKGTARLVRDLRKRHYDLAVVFPNSFSSAWMAFLARAKQRVGYAAEGRGRLLTTRLPLPKDYRKRHLAESYTDLVRELGIDVKASVPHITLDPDIKREGEAFLQEAGIPKDIKVIGVGPGATYGEAKRWDPERFAEVGRKLVAKGYWLVLLGVREEKALCDRIGEGIGEKAINLAGETDLRALVGVLAHCSAFVSNDTGVMHLAAALEIPVVGLFGSTSPEWTRPLGRAKVIYKRPYCSPCFARTCPDGSRRCWKAIGVEEVLSVVEEYLA